MSFTRMGDGLAGVVKSWAKDPEFRWSLIERAWRSAAGASSSLASTSAARKLGAMPLRFA